MISADVDEVMSGMIRCDNPKLGLLACPTWHKGQTLDAALVLRYALDAAQDARSSTHQHNDDDETQQKTCQKQPVNNSVQRSTEVARNVMLACERCDRLAGAGYSF